MKKTRNCKTARDAAIYGGQIYFEDVRQCGLSDELAHDILDDTHLKAIRVISLSRDWYNEVYLWDAAGATIKETINYQFTMRKEKRGQRWCWYAYRRVAGTLFKRYVGISEEITEERLLKIAQALPG